MMEIIYGVIAGIIVAILLSPIPYLRGRFDGEKKLRQKYNNGLNSFAEDLGKLIFTNGPNPNIQARAIVSTRDTAREQIDNLRALLNSEIDLLRDQLASAAPAPVISETIDVLRASWPAKKNLIEVATRRVLATLGITEI